MVILLLRQIYALVISDWIGEKTCKHQSTENKDISKMNVAQLFGSLCTNSLKGINKHKRIGTIECDKWIYASHYWLLIVYYMFCKTGDKTDWPPDAIRL